MDLRQSISFSCSTIYATLNLHVSAYPFVILFLPTYLSSSKYVWFCMPFCPYVRLFSACLPVYVCACLPFRLKIMSYFCLSVSMSCLSVCLHVCVYQCVCLYMFVCMALCFPMGLYVFLGECLLSFCLSVNLSISLLVCFSVSLHVSLNLYLSCDVLVYARGKLLNLDGWLISNSLM